MRNDHRLRAAIRADYVQAKGKLLAAGCPVSDARKKAASFTRRVWREVAEEKSETGQNRIRAALRAVITGD
ncbi:hypothetical protein [Shimia aestuarii]|uniref:Uncharacterized protein n=1 Tax=Shimia aestuarii TaxID=254406 RepID=A0A1I4IPV7_9RHOB|nr:hypothetical protein [Shimia aestuarii]SFL55796.1 hypothetical protein SAMN04488042_101675 [Shimia aestuarii]